MRKHHSCYPVTVARYFNLQGGTYGTIDLIAPDDDHLELQLGGDFVRLTRNQVEELRCGLKSFLDLEWREPPPSSRPSDRPPSEGGIGKAIKHIAGEVAEAIGVRSDPEAPSPDDPRRRRR
jgi:hypothetical protein